MKSEEEQRDLAWVEQTKRDLPRVERRRNAAMLVTALSVGIAMAGWIYSKQLAEVGWWGFTVSVGPALLRAAEARGLRAGLDHHERFHDGAA